MRFLHSAGRYVKKSWHPFGFGADLRIYTLPHRSYLAMCAHAPGTKKGPKGKLPLHLGPHDFDAPKPKLSVPFLSTLILMTTISDKPLWASLSPNACVVCLLWWLLQHILSCSDCCWWCYLTPKGLFHTHTLNIILDDMSCIRIVLFFLSLLCQAYFYYKAIIWNKIPVS